MPRHNNPHPKFRKPYQSWKGRAECMRKHLESTGHTVSYTESGAFVMHHGRIVSYPKRWWQVWKWW